MAASASVTASSARYVRKIGGGSRGTSPTAPGNQGQKNRTYYMYRRVPEVRFAASWMANAMSGVRLFAGRRAPDGTIEHAPDGHRAAEIVSQIAGGPDGQAQMLHSFGKHLTLAGEGWVVIRPNSQVLSPYTPEDGHDWRVLSTKQVHRQGGKLIAKIDGEDIEVPEGDPETVDPDSPVAIRVWEPDPEDSIESDSPVLASLDLLEELLLLNAAVKAVARSRITGRGVLLVPKGVSFPKTPTQSGGEDDLLELFMTVAETAIREPESAAATVPIILEVPADMISEFKHIRFDSDWDELALKLREEAIRRFAIGLEIPAEVLLGLGDVNHWGAWALTSEAIRLGVKPKCATVCHAFTQQWLRPILQTERVEDWHRWLLWYDTSPLRVRTNRAETAIKVHERDAISDAALRRETGFDEDDAPTQEELERRRQDDQAPSGGGLPVDETEAPPNTLAAAGRPADAALTVRQQTLLAAVDGLIHLIMYSVGEKIRTKPACPRSERSRAREIPPAELHTVFPVEEFQVDAWHLLDGAWDRVPEISERYGLDADCLSSTLDEYVRGLIAARMAHSYEETERLFRNTCIGAAA